MPPRDHLQAEGTVREVLRGPAYRVELANGHRCVARSAARPSAAFLPGESVLLAFHPYDLSRARIIQPGSGAGA